MSDESQTVTALDELSMLKQRAKLMGIPFHPSVSLETLRTRINDKLEGTANEVALAPSPAANPGADAAGSLSDGDPAVNPLKDAVPKVKRKLTLRQHMRNTQMRLIRLRITNLDP